MNGFQIGSKRLKVQHKRTADNDMFGGGYPLASMPGHFPGGHHEPLIRTALGTPESVNYPEYSVSGPESSLAYMSRPGGSSQHGLMSRHTGFQMGDGGHGGYM